MSCTFDLSIGWESILVQASTTADRIDTVIIDRGVKTVYYLVGCVALTALLLTQQLL